MIRSNSKKAIENIKNYVVENADFSSYGIETPTDFESVAKGIMSIFYNEILKWDKRRISYFEKFKEWCGGLPSALDTCYYYNRSAITDIAKILDETESESEKYTEQKAEELLTWLIWREIYKACNYSVFYRNPLESYI